MSPNKKKTKISPGPPLVDTLPSDCLGVVASFLSLSEVANFQDTCSAIQVVVQSVSEELFKQLAFSKYSEQHMLAIKAHVKGERPWRAILKQQIESKKKKPARTYSLEDFRIVVSFEVPDLTSYQLNRNRLISIVSPVSVDPNGELVLDEPSITLDFISASMLDDATSPFGNLLPEQLKRLKEQMANVILEAKDDAESQEEKLNARHVPPPELDALLEMVQEYLPCYHMGGHHGIKRVIHTDEVDVSCLHAKTGRMAFIDKLRCEDWSDGSLHFGFYDGFHPVAFRGNPYVNASLRSE
jgi:hypothetical protein